SRGPTTIRCCSSAWLVAAAAGARTGWIGPLDAAVGLNRFVGHARVVAEAARRHAFPFLERVLGLRPPWKERVAAAELAGEIQEDVEVGARLARRRDRPIDFADAPLRVRVRAVLLAPDGGRQHEVG